MVHEVTTIAHSCGVDSPRELRRHHARLVVRAGISVPLDQLYRPEYRAVTVQNIRESA